MNLKKSIERLSFTISKQNKPNQTDADALNVILQTLGKIEENAIDKNLPFSKLFIFLLTELTIHYDNSNLANKKINEVLNTSTENLIQHLVLALKKQELSKIFNDDFLKPMNDSDIKKTFLNYPNFKEKFLESYEFWNYENTLAALKKTITLSLNIFKNV